VFKALFCLSIEDLASVQGKADNETSASSGLSPNVATMVEDGLAREGQPKPDAVLLACCHERFEQPVANPVRNSRSRVFNFNQYIATGFPGYNVKLPPAGIASRALVTRLKNTRSIWEHIRHFEQDLYVKVVRGCRSCIGRRSDYLADVTNLGRRPVAASHAA
jgi:hypothetical protein